jgi:hypothetical protein
MVSEDVEIKPGETAANRMSNNDIGQGESPSKLINTIAAQSDPPASVDKSQKYIQYQLLHLSRQSAAYFRRL